MTGVTNSVSNDRPNVESNVRQVVLEYLGHDKNGAAPVLNVQTSSRHRHVCREDMGILFGPGSELTFDCPLYQEGNFAPRRQSPLSDRAPASFPTFASSALCASSRRSISRLLMQSCLGLNDIRIGGVNSE